MASETNIVGAGYSIPGSDTDWTNVSNITADDASWAYATKTTGSNFDTDYIEGDQCGFAIPAGATIDGIEVETEVKSNRTGSDWTDRIGVLRYNNADVGSGKDLNDVITTTAETQVRGDSADLWSWTPTDTEINHATFGMADYARCGAGFYGGKTFYMNYMKITVYYTAAAGGAEVTAGPILLGM